MIRSSALYISLIVSLLILMICGGMLLIGYTYRMQDRKQERMLRLRRNLDSGRELLLLQTFKADTSMRISLFTDADSTLTDSVALEKRSWGLYEMGTVRTWQAGDTLSKSFLMAAAMEDALQVFYLADEDRPVSISGKSKIRGTAYLPKSGIKAAYVGGSGYADKTLVYGRILESGRTLKSTDSLAWNQLVSWISGLDRSKYEAHVRLSSERKQEIIVADSSITVDASARLAHVILVAPYIHIESNFEGSLQALASDSISTGARVKLRYPSALAVLKPDTAGYQVRIRLGQENLLEGQAIAYEKKRSQQMPVLEIGASSLVKGELWSRGYVTLGKNSRVEGAVSAIRLLSRIEGAIYENYLIDVTLDRPALSKYYLSNRLIQSTKKKNKVLCWLN